MFQQVTGAVIDINLGIQALVLQLTVEAVFIPFRLRYGFEKDIKGWLGIPGVVLCPVTWKYNDKEEQTI